MAGLLWLYFVLHLFAGLALPYRRGVKPYLSLFIENAGIDLERRLNREGRPQSVRFKRGCAVAAVLGLAACVVGYIIHWLSDLTYGWSVELAFLSVCITFMTPLKVIRQMSKHLEKDEVQQAAEALQPYMKAPIDKNDIHAVVRKAVEFMVISLVRFLVAPSFWAVALGAPGLALFVTYSALNEAFEKKKKKGKHFGRCVRVIDRVLNIIPALLTAAVLCISSLFVSQSDPRRAAKTFFDQRGKDYLSWPMAAMAGGLGVTLCGPARYSQDYVEERPWIGPPGSSARLTHEDLERAAMLQYVFFICFVGLHSVLIIFGM